MHVTVSGEVTVFSFKADQCGRGAPGLCWRRPIPLVVPRTPSSGAISGPSLPGHGATPDDLGRKSVADDFCVMHQFPTAFVITNKYKPYAMRDSKRVFQIHLPFLPPCIAIINTDVNNCGFWPKLTHTRRHDVLLEPRTTSDAYATKQ